MRLHIGRVNNVYMMQDNVHEYFPNRECLSFDEIYELTGSKKLLDILKQRAGLLLDISRTSTGRLIVMDVQFLIGEKYAHLRNSAIYECTAYDPVDAVALLRDNNPKRTMGVLSASSTTGWAIAR